MKMAVNAIESGKADVGAPGSPIELHGESRLLDDRAGALLAAIHAERIAGFPSGQLFLDSIERALAAAQVNSPVRDASPQVFKGGLSPSRLRRVTELVHAKIDDELTLEQMANEANLSVAHFSQMFRKSTGQSPHQFVLRQRVERAKERAAANGHLVVGTTADEYDVPGNYVHGANIAGFRKVADAMLAQGVV